MPNVVEIISSDPPHTYIPTLPSTLGLNASFFLLIVLNSQSSAAGAGPSAPSPPCSPETSRLANGRDEFRGLEQKVPCRLLGLTSAQQWWVLRWVVAVQLGSEEKRVKKKGLQSLRSEPFEAGIAVSCPSSLLERCYPHGRRAETRLKRCPPNPSDIELN
ncbi:Hexosyltransferase [Psidium guajava]|nr:Hexosyltransferase [Psidium guajava]